jgi:hypothetical protein
LVSIHAAALDTEYGPVPTEVRCEFIDAPRGRPRRVQHPVHVGRHDPAPVGGPDVEQHGLRIRLVRFGQVAAVADSGGGDGDVEVAGALGGHRHRGAARVRVGDVGGHEERRTVDRGQLRRELLPGRGIQVGDRDGDPVGGEPADAGGTDATGAAGDEGGPDIGRRGHYCVTVQPPSTTSSAPLT